MANTDRGGVEAVTYRPEPTIEKTSPPRSVWSTTGIFIALGVLTLLMALLMYGAIQGVTASGVAGSSDPSPVMRATR